MIRLLLIFFAFWLFGFVRFVDNLPQPLPEKEPTITDAIVVLTGGTNRISHGLSLLAQNKTALVFISGVGNDVRIQDILQEYNKNAKKSLRLKPSAPLILGTKANNTSGNADEVAEWLQQNNIKDIRLITSNYHMPRSEIEFSKKLTDVEIYYDPVAPNNINMEQWYVDYKAIILLSSEFNKYIATRIGKAFTDYIVT